MKYYWLLLLLLVRSCYSDTLPDNEANIVVILTKVTCGLSICGAGSIILCYLTIVNLKNKLLKDLVIGLSVCDLGTGIVDILPSYAVCKAQAILGMYFPMASFIYTDSIGLMIYLSVVELKTKRDLNSMLKYFHILAFTVPLILCIIIIVYDVEGDDNGFGTGVCWIPYKYQNWRLLGGKVLEWLSWVFVLCCYLTTLWRISKLNIPTDLRSTSLKLLFIPAIFVILRVPSAIRTIHDYLGGEQAIFWLSILQALGDYGQGFANGIWFVGFQPEVRREVKSYFFGQSADMTISSSESDLAAALKAPGLTNASNTKNSTHENLEDEHETSENGGYYSIQNHPLKHITNQRNNSISEPDDN